MSNQDQQQIRDSIDGDPIDTDGALPGVPPYDANSTRNRSEPRNDGAQPDLNVQPENESSEDDDDDPVVTQGCVIIGPSGAGKTTLLAAMHRSCQMIDDDGIKLKFAATNTNTATRIREGIDNILNISKGYPSTNDVQRYPFYIHVTEKRKNFWSPALVSRLYVELTDGGGGFIFLPNATTDALRREITSQIRGAAVLVLCIDAEKPNLDMLSRELEGLLADVRQRVRVSPEIPFAQKVLRRLRILRTPANRYSREPCLNVDRVLILLTQIDKLAKFHRYPLEIAKRMEPVALAVQLLTPHLLGTLLDSLKPNAQLAVGICSSYGFIPQTGGTFADVTGKPNVVSEGQGEAVLRRWTPFGIREAIYFIATGKSRGSVKRITEDDLKPKKLIALEQRI